MKTQHIRHAQGGVITAIESIGHSTYHGVADWYFVGHCTWDNGGGESTNLRIPPFALVYDKADPEAKAEGDAWLERLNAYLARVGDWHEQKRARNGMVYSWTPKTKCGEEVTP